MTSTSPGTTGSGGDDLGAAIDALRTTLRAASDFNVPWEQFHDDVCERPDFMDAGHPDDNARLVAVLPGLAAKVFGREQEVGSHVFLHLTEHGFWHGTCEIGAAHAAFFYFEDLDAGLVGFLRSLSDLKVDLVRFSLVAVPKGNGTSRGRGKA